MRVIELVEYEPRHLQRPELSAEEGRLLHAGCRDRVAVEFPNPANENTWVLCPEGKVGRFSVTPDLQLSITPKVPIANLFRMLEYAYRLRGWDFGGITDCDSLNEFYERLASILTNRVLDRARRGLYAAYVDEEQMLPYLRGSLDLPERIRRPWQVHLTCQYQEHTTDVEDNQLVAWTLGVIARSGHCSDRVLPAVRAAYRCVQDATSAVPFRPDDCVGRLYTRLNSDYQILHGLCRFFLDHSGPTHARGDRTMVPFLIDMAALYEAFLAEWLLQHMPAGFSVHPKQKLRVRGSWAYTLEMDILIKSGQTAEPLYVLDAKYKAPEKPSTDDINQAVTYAEAVGCHRAALVYPTRVGTPLQNQYGRNAVRTLTFPLGGDIEAGGGAFLESWLPELWELLEATERRGA